MSIDPRTRRDLHFEARAQSLKTRGLEVRSDALLREVSEDLRLVDRARSEGLLGARPKRTKRKFVPRFTRQGVARPELHAESLAAKAGGQFFARAVKDAPSPFPEDHVRGVDAERRNAMLKRIRLLAERGPGRIKANQTIEQGPWLYPDFARQVALTCFAFNARLGGYRGLRASDRRRRFFRALEDICNRSDSAVGVGWWVPK